MVQTIRIFFIFAMKIFMFRKNYFYLFLKMENSLAFKGLFGRNRTWNGLSVHGPEKLQILELRTGATFLLVEGDGNPFTDIPARICPSFVGLAEIPPLFSITGGKSKLERRCQHGTLSYSLVRARQSLSCNGPYQLQLRLEALPPLPRPESILGKTNT